MYKRQMLLSEKLYPHLLEIDETAQSRLEQMMPQLAKEAGATEAWGSLLINPTVSDRRKSFLSFCVILRTVVSRVAKSISFAIAFVADARIIILTPRDMR